jgi:hypothetical protein
MNKIKGLIREPLLLFFLFGIFAFILYTKASDYIEKKNKQIVISKVQVELLEESYKKIWNRTPTEKELNALIENAVMDEIFFRQAVAMGLDKSDPAIKRRLRQQMEMMLDDYTTIYPTASQLSKYLSENPDKFRKEPRISFRHFYFPFEKKEEAIDLLQRLQKGNTVGNKAKGYPILMDPEFENERKRVIENQFGNSFTSDIFEIESEIWHGPIESAYGWHLARVSNKIKGELPDLNEIWDIVEREWSVDRKKEMKEEQYEIMKAQYEVAVE